MPGVKRLLVAVVGETDMVENYVTPQTAAKLARKYSREQVFARFASEVGQAHNEEALAESQTTAPHQLCLTVFDEAGDLIDGAMSVAAVGKLAEQFQREQLFLDFAAEVAREAKRLRKQMNEEQQLQLFWQE